GTVYAAQQATTTRNNFFAGRGGAGGAGGAGGGGGVSGTIKSISGDTIQVSTALSVTTVTLGTTTTVLKTSPGTTADLQVRQQVTVRGQRDAAGNVTATTIQVVPAGTNLGGPGGGGNGGGGNGGNGGNGNAATATPAP